MMVAESPRLTSRICECTFKTLDLRCATGLTAFCRLCTLYSLFVALDENKVDTSVELIMVDLCRKEPCREMFSKLANKKAN